MKVQVNLFEYAGKPFEDGLRAVVYHPAERIPEEKKYLINAATMKVQDSARQSSTAVQFGDRIFCVIDNPDALERDVRVVADDHEFLWNLTEKDTILLSTDEENREILRRLVAKAVANQQIKKGWFVERYRLVYHWSFSLTERLLMEHMDVYPGFVFRPYIYADGSCAIMIDPKFKFVPRETLRNSVDELISRGVREEDIALMFEGETVFDACPIFDCNFRKDPASVCRLKGAGRGRVLIRLNFASRPSEANFGNLIRYHMRENVCPKQGELGRSIRDKPPIALVESSTIGELLEFPLERLREELKLHRLSKVGRLFVMKYIRPPTDERWNLTRSFVGYVDNIPINSSVVLRLTREFAVAGSSNKPWANYNHFEEIPLQFAGSLQDPQPLMGLEKYGPYDLSGKKRRAFNELSLSLYNFSSKLGKKDLQKFYNALVKGFLYRPSFQGIEKLFRLRVPEFSEDLIQFGGPNINRLVTKSSPHVVIVIAPHIGHGKMKQYRPFKQELTRAGIASQFVLDENIDPETPASHYSGYLKNVALGIYYKAGGVPWALSRPVAKDTCFIGLDMVARQRMAFMSLQIFNSQGVWLGGWTDFVNKEHYPALLEGKLIDAMKIYSKEEEKEPERVVVHKEGEVWSKAESASIERSLGEKCEIIGAKKVSIPRMYDAQTRDDYMVERGTCVQIDTDTALLATSGPPHPIRGSQRFLTIQKYHTASDFGVLMRACKEIFELSLVYGGYGLAITSKPITTHFANAAVSLATKYRIRDNPKLWKQAWFV